MVGHLTPDVARDAHRVAHVVQRVEDAHQVVPGAIERVGPVELVAGGDLEADAVGDPCLDRALPRRRDR